MRPDDLRSFLARLESEGELARVSVEADPDQDITIIQHKVLAAGGPALLFERVKGSPYRLASNLFGTRRRVEMAFGRPPGEIGAELVTLAERLMPPTLGGLWAGRRTLRRLLNARLKVVRSGPVAEQCFEPPQLDRLPCLTCWPLDGGPFFTLPLVFTADPATGRGNLGIYRLQRFDAASTGMHWQIEKGGAFHFRKACDMGRPLPVSVFLGGPPALTLAAIAPLPEDVDERLLAALILGRPLRVVRRSTTGHCIPASAEFVLEGTVSPGDVHKEGPFGDHLGHYSHSADFPVFRVDRVLARKDAIYPATVVGKPPQEDYFIGEALQEMALPLLKLGHPGLSDLWAYPETGFHPLAVAAVKERYQREAFKCACALMGQGQLSLTKVLIVVDADVNVRDFAAVSGALWRNLSALDGVHLLAPTAQDTLDFTGPAMNTGSKLLLLATSNRRAPRGRPPAEPPRPASPGQSPATPWRSPADVHPDILGMARLGEAVLVAQVRAESDGKAAREALARHPVASEYLFHVLVSPDVPLDDPRLMLWGWFTRFDPLADIHPARRELAGNQVRLHFPIAFDARWKPGYRLPVAFDPERLRRVESEWPKYGIRPEARR